VVVDYAGTDHCSFIIELDNGEKIQPLHFPEELEFVQGQRVLVDYVKLPNVIPTCDKGVACDILNVEELNCGSPITDLFAHNYDSLANDPVHLHEIFVDGDCLNMDKPVAMFNPELSDLSQEKFEMWDDCMSFPNLLVKVRRHKSLTLTFFDLNREKQVWHLQDDLAELIQHEYDHLEGILATQRAIDDQSFQWKA
jgi:hypothetical protein